MRARNRAFADVNGRSIHYVLCGQGARKIVMVPPLGGNTNSYGPEFDALAEGGMSAGYDWGGQGISEKLPFQYDMDYLVEELVGFLDVLGWKSADGLGVAAGSAILLSACLKYPERFDKLALMSPCAFVPATTGEGMRQRAESVASDGMRSSLAASVSKGFAPQYSADVALATKYAGEYLANDPVAYARASTAFSYFDQLEHMAEISQQCLLLPGEFDPYFPVALSEEMATQLPRARVSVLEGCGHFSQLERPAEIVSRVRAFMES